MQEAELDALETFLKFGGSLKINIPKEVVDYVNRVKAGLNPENGHVLSEVEKSDWLKRLSERGLV